MMTIIIINHIIRNGRVTAVAVVHTEALATSAVPKTPPTR
jgi:hypothetical protein